jgi:hypothetical protein
VASKTLMRASSLLIALCIAVIGTRAALAADSGPVIVIPGRLGAPVIINGLDVSGAVVEGDFGLYSPHMVAPRVISGPVAIPQQFGPRGYYYPAFGRVPGYGRYEIETPAEHRPAPSFHRSWTSQSEPLPPTLDPPPQSPVLLAPQIYPQGRRRGRRP